MKGKLIYGAALLLLLASVTWQWLQFEAPSLKKPLLPPALPVLQPLDSGSLLETVLANNLWSQSRGRVDAPAEAAIGLLQDQAVSWALKGIGFQQGHGPTAMIAAGVEVKVYHEGDLLPGGAKLLRIMAHGVVVEMNGEERNVYLFKEE